LAGAATNRRYRASGWPAGRNGALSPCGAIVHVPSFVHGPLGLTMLPNTSTDGTALEAS
jgi:hypothetical protein